MNSEIISKERMDNNQFCLLGNLTMVINCSGYYDSGMIMNHIIANTSLDYRI